MTTVLSHADCYQMYSQCIVEYKGVIGLVRDISEEIDPDLGGHALYFRPVGKRNNLIIPADPDQIFCPSDPLRLGYVQYDDRGASYLRRTPRRQYRVGWCSNNVEGLDVVAFTNLGEKFLNNLKGIYVSFKEAVDLSAEHDGTVAFDRQFAVRRGSILEYRGSGIVRLNAETKMPELGRDYAWLAEQVEQAIQGA